MGRGEAWQGADSATGEGGRWEKEERRGVERGRG